MHYKWEGAFGKSKVSRGERIGGLVLLRKISLEQWKSKRAKEVVAEHVKGKIKTLQDPRNGLFLSIRDSDATIIAMPPL